MAIPPDDSNFGSRSFDGSQAAQAAGAQAVARVTGPTPPPAELLGTVLRGTYRIQSALDEGGMGKLYLAEHVRLRRPVAVKVLAQHLAADQGALVRFHREAEIVSQLHHPHIVHILDFDTTESGQPYIVMELLSGESLAKRIDRERILPLRDSVTIVTQIAGALQLAHAAGIVHRDLKPDNVFLLAIEDGNVFVKLLDFGISRGAAASSRMTGEFDVLGTPDYMAPEQAVSTAKADHLSDQFALAAMAYELLSGRMPFYGETVMEILTKVIHSEPEPLSRVAPGIPAGIDLVIARALSKQPQLRFPSVHDFAAALAQAAGPNGSNEARTASGVPTARPPTVRNSSPVDSARSPSPSPDDFDPHTKIRRAHEAPASALVVPTTPPAVATSPTQPGPAARRKTSGLHGDLGNPRVRRTEPPPSLPSPPPPLNLSPTRMPQFRHASSHELTTPGRRPPRAVLRSNVPSDRTPAPFQSSSNIPAPRTASGNPTPLTMQGAVSLKDVQQAIEEARQAHAFGETSRLLAQCRRATRLARYCGAPQARELLAKAADFLEAPLLDALGGRSRRVELLSMPSADSHGLGPEHLYILTRLDGPLTVDELLQLSPLSTPETLCLILELSSAGALKLH